MKTISSLLCVTFLLSTTPSLLFASYQLDEQLVRSNALMATGLLSMGMGCITAKLAVREENCRRRPRTIANNGFTILTAECLVGGAALVGIGYALSPSSNP